MFELKASFRRKDTEIDTTNCVVDKVIKLSSAEFDHFSKNLLKDRDFIRDNPIDIVVDKEGRYHCLLVVGENRRDGILVNPEGGNYARYSAFIPNAEYLLTVGQYPALAELNRKLADLVEFIAQPVGQRHVIDIQRFEEITGIDFMYNGVLRDTLFGMLNERPEIKEFEFDKNDLIVYRVLDSAPVAEDFSDPTVTLTDMYAYGYGWDGMIPLGKERALELFDAGHEIFRLYEKDAEGAANLRTHIEAFDGMFGIENPDWVQPEHEPPIQAFILNREQFDKGETAGEWLTLPVDAGTLCGLFERIGIDRRSESAFTITAIRSPDCISNYVSKYDNLDELNMLALYISDLEDYEFDKFKAILTSGVADIGRGTAALINLLDADNFYGFELIDADDAESLAKYYDRENSEKPDSVSFKDYGEKCVKEEGGKFTEHGYIKFKYDKLSTEYNGVVPSGYKIVGDALRGILIETHKRNSGEKPSVMDEIKAAQKAPEIPRKTKTPDKKKNKGDEEL